MGVSEPWPAFCLDEALFVRHRLWLNEQQEGGARYRPDGYDPPAKDKLVSIPWGGDGPDPLRGI